MVERESLSLGAGLRVGTQTYLDFRPFISSMKISHFSIWGMPSVPANCHPMMHLGGAGDGAGRQKASQRGGGGTAGSSPANRGPPGQFGIRGRRTHGEEKDVRRESGGSATPVTTAERTWA